ncbi:hypothetical protein LDENG_00183330 [Lucifuga dentata]|nr:hypothetical protein LDENG_00183330 [Lucifuga dentata]
MSASRVSGLPAVKSRSKPSVSRSEQKHRASGGNRVLAERNQAVAAVGAWVEGGQDFLQHPSALASLTEELQAERRRENQESLQRFQHEVRHRVAKQAQFNKRQQLQQRDKTVTEVTCGRRIPWQDEDQHVSAGQKLLPASQSEPHIPSMHQDSQSLHEGVTGQQSRKGIRQVRDRLAACRMIPDGDEVSALPGGRWNVSKAESHMPRAEQEDEEEEDLLFSSQHDCPLIQQNVNEYPALSRTLVSGDVDQSQPDPGSRVPQVLWPLTDQEQQKRQRQSQFLLHRRQFMNIEREQVKENRRDRKHLKRSARIKEEKEQIRQEEERKLERLRELAEARQKMEERELLILERLRLEEEERMEELERRKRREEEKVAAR